MNIINNTNFINFKSLIPFYYPRGKDVDRAEILAREIEYHQILDEEEIPVSSYGEQLTDEELDSRLAELNSALGVNTIARKMQSLDEEDEPKKPVRHVFQTEDSLPEDKRKLDIRG